MSMVSSLRVLDWYWLALSDFQHYSLEQDAHPRTPFSRQELSHIIAGVILEYSDTQ